jgi:hypothetical protein
LKCIPKCKYRALDGRAAVLLPDTNIVYNNIRKSRRRIGAPLLALHAGAPRYACSRDMVRIRSKHRAEQRCAMLRFHQERNANEEAADFA